MRPTHLEADLISEHLTRRDARNAPADSRARRYALRAVGPSPARLDAPEPSAWLPILDLTEELEAIDITGELELIALEEGRVDLEEELAALESDFWRTAEAEHPFLTGELPAVSATDPGDEVGAEDRDRTPVTADPVPVPVRSSLVPPAAPEARAAAPVGAMTPRAVAPQLLAPEPAPTLTMPVPEAYAQLRPSRPAIVHRRRALRLRRRIILTALVVAVAAACIGATARVLGGTPPRRDVTVSIDGRANTVVTRAGTVSDLLAAQGTVIRAGDRVIPGLATPLRQGMPIQIVRAFPVVLDVDGVVTKHRTTRRSLGPLRRELGLAASLVAADGPRRLARGSRLVFRTPHAFDLVVDGTTTPLTGVTALTVRALLGEQSITLGPKDEVQPPLDAALADGQTVRVFRLAEDEVAEDKLIPFTRELRNDPTIAAGQTATIQAGRNGTVRVVSTVVRKDGVVIQWTENRRIVLAAPVPEILRRGTKPSGKAPPVAPPASGGGGRLFQTGTATWYASHAGAGACAHLTLPFGTIVKLVNTANGRTAQCRVGDRGPQAWTGHIIDLNPDVFGALAPLGTGTITVRAYI